MVWSEMCRGVHGMWHYVVCNVKWGSMRDVVWGIKCGRYSDLKYGIAKWNSVLREVLVWYEMCYMVRNDGLTWNVVWFGIKSEMVVDVEWCNVKCGGMMWCGAMCYTFHISPPLLNNFHIKLHFRHSTPYHISHHSTFSVHYHQITRRDVE